MSDERWLPIGGYEGRYSVSDRGRVRRDATGASMALHPAKGGYLGLVLRRDGERKRHHIHRLVAVAFIGSPPFDRAEVNHIDGNKSNNTVENLEWVTSSQNKQHARATGLWVAPPPRFGEEAYAAKLTQAQADEIRALKGRQGARKIAARYGISRSTVQQIHQEKKWTTVA